MCCKHAPDPNSVRDSLLGFLESQAAAVKALGIVLLAVVSWPLRRLRAFRSTSRQGQPASTGHIDLQVHLANRKQVAELERAIRAALAGAAHTWAPHSLPVDRVVVHASAPPAGKADIFDGWFDPSTRTEAQPLTVVSLGLYDGQRPLDACEVAGALALQIERLVVERHERRKAPVDAASAVPASEPGSDAAPGTRTAQPASRRAHRALAAPTTRATKPVANAKQTDVAGSTPAPPTADATENAVNSLVGTETAPGADSSSVRALLKRMQVEPLEAENRSPSTPTVT